MATTTTNLGLTKPAYTETADIAVINANMDIIDSAVGALQSASSTHTSQISTLQSSVSESASDISTLQQEVAGISGNVVTGVKGNAETAYRKNNVNITAANVGAAAASHTHSAADVTSGTLSVQRGGTGRASLTQNAVLTGDGTSTVKTVSTANGAAYATSNNGVLQFGALPIAQGGTGKTTAADAWTALGGGPLGKKSALDASDLPIVPVSKGGTGQTGGRPLNGYSLYYDFGGSNESPLNMDTDTPLGMAPLASCRMVEVFFRDNDWNIGSARLISGNGFDKVLNGDGSVTLSTVSCVGTNGVPSGQNIQIKTRRVSMNSSQIIDVGINSGGTYYDQAFGEMTIASNGAISFSSATNHIYIWQVIGYV